MVTKFKTVKCRKCWKLPTKVLFFFDATLKPCDYSWSLRKTGYDSFFYDHHVFCVYQYKIPVDLPWVHLRSSMYNCPRYGHFYCKLTHLNDKVHFRLQKTDEYFCHYQEQKVTPWRKYVSVFFWCMIILSITNINSFQSMWASPLTRTIWQPRFHLLWFVYTSPKRNILRAWYTAHDVQLRVIFKVFDHYCIKLL